uniref:NB-ARC domain-containing protein n=1 Tax=Triticum urartu TaxID=4572 RepID=A0A8R7PPE1_TRIUA
MASYCCFRKSRTRLPSFTVPRYRLITLQDMLCLILRPEGEVVAIEGIGGLGKTWAAKAAFETARNSNRFDTYIWVSLSTSCSLRRCTEKIATCLLIDIGAELSSSRIRVMIKEHLTRRKFLLVLDNAYFVEENILGKLGIPCPREQSLGSKVIVTTRTGRTVSVMDPAILISPQPLTDQASYDLLREKIGKDIDLELVDNCFGMPLSIILLAGALCDMPAQESSKLISEAYVALGPKISVFTTMVRLVKFCYRRLPSDTARRCFLYCLLFPDDEAIPVKDLIILWKLDGIIQEARDSHEANYYGEEILHVLLKHGLIHFEGDHHIRIHDVIRETVSQVGRENGYVEQPEKYFDNDIPFEYLLAKFGRRISLMNNTVKEELRASPSHECFSTSTLLLRGNRHMRSISEEFFCRVGMLRVLDLSFTPIRTLPQSISRLFHLRLLLLVGCGHLERIQHIGSLEMLEALSASGCGSLKRVECGSFDRMGLLKILDLSRTSIECLPSLAACMELNQLLLQDCPCLKFEQTTETNHNSCDTTAFIKFPYGVSKTGAVSN